MTSQKGAGARVAFGDVVKLSKERSRDPDTDGYKRYVGLDHLEPGELKIRRWGDVSDGTTFTNVFKPGQVLFGKRRAYQRKVAVADFTGVCSSDIYVFEAKDSALLAELLPFICQTDSFFEYAIGTSAGSLSPRTTWKSLATYELDLPPIDEQKRLVAALTAANHSRQALFHLLKSTRRVGRAASGEAINRLIGEHGTIKLEACADVAYGLTVSATRRKAPTQEPYLRVANVLRDALDLTEIKLIGFLPADEKHRVLPGDVLVVEGHASATQVGRAAIWPEGKGAPLHQNHLIRVRAHASTNPKFLSITCNSHHGQRYFRSRAKSTSGLHTINSSVVRGFPIPNAPINAQIEMAELWDQVNAASHKQSARMKKVDQIFRSLLRELEGTSR